jgi:predicted alpha/beta-hydrolase family hydrolase
LAVASSDSKAVAIVVNDTTRVSGRLDSPRESKACLVLAPGAGAGMDHPFMAALSHELALRSISTLRYQFPYMERGDKRPDSPPLCHATVRAAVGAARLLAPELPLFAGGKSFGGRMTSQAQAATPLPAVRGLVFFGFPLHPPDQPSVARGAHLAKVGIPMLFLQGTRDNLADLELLRPLIDRLRDLATLRTLDGADHSFHVLVRSGRTDAQVRSELADAFLDWSASIPGG